MRHAPHTHPRAGRLRAELRFLVCAALGLAVGSATLPALESSRDAGAGSGLVSPAHAQNAPPPVELGVDSVFGHDALLPGGYTTLVVRATNRTSSALQGEVTVEARTWDRIVSVHRAPLDLPPRARAATRRSPSRRSKTVSRSTSSTARAGASWRPPRPRWAIRARRARSSCSTTRPACEHRSSARP